MNRQKGYFNFDFNAFFFILVLFGIILGYGLSFILPVLWNIIIVPLLLTLV